MRHCTWMHKTRAHAYAPLNNTCFGYVTKCTQHMLKLFFFFLGKPRSMAVLYRCRCKSVMLLLSWTVTFESKRSQTDFRHVVKASSKKLVYLRLSMKWVWQLVEMAFWQCVWVWLQVISKWMYTVRVVDADFWPNIQVKRWGYVEVINVSRKLRLQNAPNTHITTNRS